MAGPNVVIPPAQSQVFDIVTDDEGKLVSLTMKQEWAAYFQALGQITNAVSRNGSTSARPTSSFVARFEGMPFLDRTLGIPVFLKHASSNVWVDATGAVV